MLLRLLSVGADPELFLRRADGTPQSSEGLIGGTKVSPRQIPGLEAGFAVQEDNVAVEFNIPPAADSKTFSNHIAKAIAYINKISKEKALTLCFEAALHFPEDQLMTPHATRLGCEPDFNAWTMTMNPPPLLPGTLRTAAGHVHVGFDPVTMVAQEFVVKALDLWLTVPSIVATPRPLSNTNRRSLYGRAGACRPKPYGVEHRSLDNFWIAEPKNRQHVFNVVKQAVDWLKNDSNDALVELDNWKDEIQQAINEHDEDMAMYLMDYFDLSDFPVR